MRPRCCWSQLARAQIIHNILIYTLYSLVVYVYLYISLIEYVYIFAERHTCTWCAPKCARYIYMFRPRRRNRVTSSSVLAARTAWSLLLLRSPRRDIFVGASHHHYHHHHPNNLHLLRLWIKCHVVCVCEMRRIDSAPTANPINILCLVFLRLQPDCCPTFA